MGERRFYLREQINEAEIDYPEYTITESELKRRLGKLVDFVDGEENESPSILTPMGFSGAINILLHGEKDDFPGPDDILKMRGKEQVDKSYQWDEWVDDMPQDMLTMNWFQAVKIWLRACPCKRT